MTTKRTASTRRLREIRAERPVFCSGRSGLISFHCAWVSSVERAFCLTPLLTRNSHQGATSKTDSYEISCLSLWHKIPSDYKTDLSSKEWSGKTRGKHEQTSIPQLLLKAVATGAWNSEAMPTPIIRAFPALPTAWKDAAFLVSAIRKNGQTQWIRIQSEAGEKAFLRGYDQTPN